MGSLIQYRPVLEDLLTEVNSFFPTFQQNVQPIKSLFRYLCNLPLTPGLLIETLSHYKTDNLLNVSVLIKFFKGRKHFSV